MPEVNFLKETREAINMSGHTFSDIKFIGSHGGHRSCNWEEFKTLANRHYTPDGSKEIVAEDLVIVFHDGDMMTRRSYAAHSFDIDTWWTVKKIWITESQKPITVLFSEFEGATLDSIEANK